MPDSQRNEPSAFSQALPIVLGYLPVGFAYGVLAVKAGLSVANTGLMSILVYAGSAQLIGVDMFGAGAPAMSIIATTFIVNLRHVLFSAALSPFFGAWPKRRIARFCFEMTDETFALHATRFHNQQRSTTKTLAINTFAHCAWILGGLAGAVAGGFVPDVKPLGLDFALAAMFAVLLVGQLLSPAHILAAALGGGIALILSQTPAAPYATLTAAIVAAAVASVTPWTRQRSS
ncbi:AzlC family ABC transporter permease [Fundidesulfovibrio terrae]|uniref:AzlC family ABC transporter permease n=1 Tax=Fundidesulfovibrio terrae TaxID=2922866 RepID=UPI001FB032CF|nr:AzlC family ABC transporter permease [Fundidesulfovibrio terrae]